MKGEMDLSAGTQYAYAVSRIRVNEKKMLDKGKLDRMIDARTPEDALKVLIEAEYGFSAADPARVFEYEKLIKEENNKAIALLKEISPQPEMFDLFLQKIDYHNVKVLIKGEFSGNFHDDMMLDSGMIPPLKLKLLLKERKMAELPVKMRKAIDEAMDYFNRTSDPQMIDLILDKAAWSQMLETARASGNSFLTGLVEAMIDLANINAFLRVRNLKKPWDFLQKVLLDGGRIDSSLYAKNLQDTLEGFINALRYTPYSKACEEGIGNFLSTGSMTRFEKLADDYILEYVKKGRYIVLGLEPLVGYLVARQMEIKNAGIIMVGKINNISGDIIRERLRETYV